MEHSTSLDDYIIDLENECLKGKISNPTFNLAGAKIVCQENIEIEGYVVELFSIIDPEHGEFRAKGIQFKIGDWYIRINIYNGFEHFINGKIRNIRLIEREPKPYEIDFESARKKGAILVKLRNVSNRCFPNFYLDIRGGETSGSGRNEHGPPHFHIIESSTKKDLGKVYFPTVNDFKLKGTQLIFKLESQLDRQSKKLIEKWVFEENLNNLRVINEEWELRNKFNNRVH